MNAVNPSSPYAPQAALRIAEAARLIIEAAWLLDGCRGAHVVAAVEDVEGSGEITKALGERLLQLAERLEQ